LIVTRARQAARAAGFLGFTAVMIPLYVGRDTLAKPHDRDAVRDRWVKRWASGLLSLFDVRVEPIDPVTPPPDGVGRLIVSNHRSAIDIGVLLQTFGGRMVSKADLSGWPVVGAAARSVGTVFVERGDAKSGAQTIRAIRDLLRAGQTIVIFPEGTTFAGDEVRPFQPGSFLSATNTGAEVLPIGLAYEEGSDAAFVGETFPQHLARMAASPKPTRVRLAIGEAIRTEKATKAAALAELSHAAVERAVTRARASFGPRTSEGPNPSNSS
jgi:1-acyl-sn-glycerol-3-phosphate acyltransferase